MSRPSLGRHRRSTALANNGVARCSRSGSSRAMHWGKVSVGKQSQASDNTAILVTVRARSFLPTGCCSTSTASSFDNVGNTGRLGLRSQWATAAGGGASGDCNGFRRNSFVMTRRRSVVSRCRHRGVRTTSGMSPLAMPANGRTPVQGAVAAAFSHVVGFANGPGSLSISVHGTTSRVAITSRSAPTPSTSRQVCWFTAPTDISTP